MIPIRFAFNAIIAANCAASGACCCSAYALDTITDQFWLGFFSAWIQARKRYRIKKSWFRYLVVAWGIYLLLLYPIALADYFNKKAWQKIGIRIIGPWVAASSLLVLTLSLSSVSAK